MTAQCVSHSSGTYGSFGSHYFLIGEKNSSKTLHQNHTKVLRPSFRTSTVSSTLHSQHYTGQRKSQGQLQHQLGKKVYSSHGISREDKGKGSESLLHNNLILHSKLADNKQTQKSRCLNKGFFLTQLEFSVNQWCLRLLHSRSVTQVFLHLTALSFSPCHSPETSYPKEQSIYICGH